MTTYHDRCPVCGVRFIGATDADLALHFMEEGHDAPLSDLINIPQKKQKECDNCYRRYTTYLGECPYCHHDGEPYK